MAVLDLKKGWDAYDAAAQATDNPRHKAILEVMKQHLKWEVLGYPDKILESVAPDGVYKFWALGEYVELANRDEIRAFYQSMRDDGTNVLQLDIDHLAVADWGLAAHGTWHQAFPGDKVPVVEVDDPSARYLVSARLAWFFPPGLAVTTNRVKLYGSIATLTTPPPLAAKQAVTIGDMSKGRFGLNLVSGLEKGSYDQMGIWPGDHHFETRYDHATEYATIVRELWETGHSDFKGTYFQMDHCHLGPTPKYPIEIVCARQSDRGTQFCAELGDYQLAIGKLDVDEMRDWNIRLRAYADAVGRTCGMHALYSVVLRDSVAEAEDAVEGWRENQDYETVAGLAGRDYGDQDAESTKHIFYSTDTFMLAFPRIVGDAKSVAEQIQELGSVEGVSGILMTFQDYLVDIDTFGREVVPRLRR